MTDRELAKLVSGLARDLRIDAIGRYELSQAAKSLLSKSDAEIRQETHRAADRTTNPVLAGAVNMIGLAIRESRLLESLGTKERADYEARAYHDMGATDPGDEEIGLALAHAQDLEGRGETAAAQNIRSAVEKHRTAQIAAGGDGE